jgi:hypothetical protein
MKFQPVIADIYEEERDGCRICGGEVPCPGGGELHEEYDSKTLFIKQSFEKAELEMEEYYDGDTRCNLSVKDEMIVFLQSDHHNGELFALICPNSVSFWEDVDKAREEQKGKKWSSSIASLLPEIMEKHGAIKVGEDSNLRKERNKERREDLAEFLKKQNVSDEEINKIIQKCYSAESVSKIKAKYQ